MIRNVAQATRCSPLHGRWPWTSGHEGRGGGGGGGGGVLADPGSILDTVLMGGTSNRRC